MLLTLMYFFLILFCLFSHYLTLPVPSLPVPYPLANMDALNIISLNAKGLNTPEKRRMLLHDMRRARADIVLLQETHFRENSLPLLKNRHYPMVFHSNYTEAKSRGVSILISSRVPWKLIDSQTDREGRFLFLKGQIGDKTVTLANLYAPNNHQDAFLGRRVGQLLHFSEGPLIVGGDLNIPMLPVEDTSSGTSSTTRHTQTQWLNAPLRTIDRHLASFPPGGAQLHFFPNHTRCIQELTTF